MKGTSPDHTDHWLRTISRYTDNLRAHQADGGSFTSEQIQEIDNILDNMEALHESAVNPERQGETGGGTQNP